MASDLDTSKAYDRLKWAFVHDMMVALGFCNTFVDLIMRSLSTVSNQVLINGISCRVVIPQRGPSLGRSYFSILVSNMR